MQQARHTKIDLTAIEYRQTPFESFGRLREMGPLVPARIWFIGKPWLVTTYDSVNEVLKNDTLFCRDPKNAGGRNLLFFQLMLPLLFRRLTENMISKDEPDHRRLRSLVDQAFQRQEISAMRSRVEELVDQQLDEIAKVSLQENGQVDLVEHFARPIPLAVICELLGLPAEDRPRFRKWFSGFANVKSVLGIAKVVPGLRKTTRYIRRQIEQVRRTPRPGLISALVEAEQSGERLTNEELLSMVMLLLLAGHETTVHLISTSILTMLQLTPVRQALMADWSRIDAAVEEMLRYNSSAQFAKPRFVTEDTEFHGQLLKRGEMVLPVLACANYDPARFDQPNEFLIDRPRNYHLTFGAGPHVCLGLKLARLETQIALQKLFTRWPELQPTFDAAQPDWAKRLGMRSLNTLQVKCRSD